MKTKTINKLLGVALTLMLLGSLTVGIGVPVAAADGSWATLATPQASVLGNYVLSATAGATAGPGLIEKAIDDSAIYAYWDNGEIDNLYKSTDFGRTWVRCSTATDDMGPAVGDATYVITGIACSTQDAKRLYVTDGLDVYRSTDAGATFIQLLRPPTTITSLAVGYNGDYFIYVGGGDGDVWIMRDGFGYIWATTGYLAMFPGPRTIVAVATSPKFTAEAQPQVMAVSTFGGNTYVSFTYGGAAWNAPILGGPDDVLLATGIVATIADVAFPGDYASPRTSRDFFVAISTAGGVGDVYRIIASTSVDTNVGGAATSVGITSVACAGNSGSCKLLAAGLGAPVYHSDDNGATWVVNQKPLSCSSTGTAKYILMDKTYLASGKALITVSRGAALDNASVEMTLDYGVSFTDLSMINTDIKQIHNMDVSSKYATDFTVFMVTSPTTGSASVWKWDGTYWTRTFVATAATPLTAATAQIQCSVDYMYDKTVFLADTATNRIYRSNDYGVWFKAQITAVPAPFNGAMLVLSSTSVIVGVGTDVYITKNNGTSWDAQTTLIGATAPIVSIAKSPAYATDKTLLLGDSLSKVFMSKDNGLNWAQVPVTAAVSTTAAATNVGFDSAYATNNYIYAALAGTVNRVYRINAATGTAWSTIDGTPAQAGVVNGSPLYPGMQMSANGTMYVATQSAPSTGTAAAADAFVIINSAGAVDAGFITVTSGSVTVAGNSATTTPASGAPVTVTAPATTAWGVAAAGDVITVTAGTAGTIGSWTQTLATTTAGLSSDVDLDARVTPNFLPTGGTFSLPDKSATAAGGSSQVMIRSLTATRTFFEAMSSGFTGTAANLRGLRYNDSASAGSPQLWVLESSTTAANNRIWTYTDRLTAATTLLTPADKTNTGRINTAALTWNSLPTASTYQIYVGKDPLLLAFTEYFSFSPAVSVPSLDGGVTYYWKVRSAPTNATIAGKASSPWSATWSFTTGLSAAEWDPFVNPARVVPIPGSYDTPIRPTFMWNPADWATGYEFVVSKAADFSNPIWSFKGTNALKISAFVADKDLEYSTSYYWSVTAVTATTMSKTAYGSFRTLAAPVAPTPPVTVASPTPAPVTVNLPPVEQIAPVWIWAIIAVGAVLVIAVIILIVTTRRVP